MARAGTPEMPNYAPPLVIVGAALVLFFAKALLVPLAFALTLTFLVVPVVRRMERRGIPRTVAVALAGLGAGAALMLGGYAVSRQVLQVAEMLPSYKDNMHHRMEALHSPAGRSIGQAIATLRDLSGDLLPGSAGSTREPMPVQIVGAGGNLELAGRLIGLTLQPLAGVLIVIVFAMYMLMKREELRRRLLMLAGTARVGLMTQALDDAVDRISRYLVLQFQFNACYGLLFGLGLFGIGVPNAILWGVLAGGLRIVPYLGTGVGMLLPLIVAIAVSTSWWPPLLVLGWFVALEVTTANFVEPRLFSSRTGISSLALLASVIVWTTLWGWPGLVLATPMTVCVAVLGRYVPQLSFLHSLLGTDAQLSPAAYFYERLLATDHQEAYDSADRFTKTHSVPELYDALLLPALSLAEEDRHRGTLDEAHAKYVLLSVGELLARSADTVDSSEQIAAKSSRAVRIDGLRSHVVKEIAVVCISTGEPADSLACQMLTQLLERGGYQTLMLRKEALSDEVLEALAKERDTIFIVSALPPFAFAAVRELTHRVRRNVPDNRLTVAIWNAADSGDEILGRFGVRGPDHAATTLAQALHQVNLWQEATQKV